MLRAVTLTSDPCFLIQKRHTHTIGSLGLCDWLHTSLGMCDLASERGVKFCPPPPSDALG